MRRQFVLPLASFLPQFPATSLLLPSPSLSVLLSGVDIWSRNCVKTPHFCCVAAHLSPPPSAPSSTLTLSRILHHRVCILASPAPIPQRRMRERSFISHLIVVVAVVSSSVFSSTLVLLYSLGAIITTDTQVRAKMRGKALTSDSEILQSCVKTFLLSSENCPQNVPLLTPKLHFGAIFQPSVPKTWQECFYTTLYIHAEGRGRALLPRETHE